MTKIVWNLPIRTVSESNLSEHWTVKSKRHKQQQFFVRSLFNHEAEEIKLPCVITLIRLSSRYLDYEENLPMAFKWIKDEIGACLFPEKVVVYHKKGGNFVKNKGHADSNPLVSWKYSQEKSKTIGIRIEIESLTDEQPIYIGHEYI